MQYYGSSYAEDVWDVFWYEKNLQGDIVAVYNDYGTKLVTYYYDAFGYCIVGYDNDGSSTRAYYNPFRYRGYYYDKDLDLYYLNARYYDGRTGRFISPDYPDVVTATPGALTDKNLYAYCDNNPVMRMDGDGEIWVPVLLYGAINATYSMIGALISELGDIGKKDAKFNPEYIIISTLLGGAEGALTVLFPAYSIAIGCVSNGLDALVDGIINERGASETIVNISLSAFLGAAGGVDVSDINKGAELIDAGLDARKLLKTKGLNPSIKKPNQKIAHKARKHAIKSVFSPLGGEITDFVLYEFWSWAMNAVVSRSLDG